MVCIILSAFSETDAERRHFANYVLDTIKKDTIKRDSLTKFNRGRKPNFRLRDRYGDPYSNPTNKSPLLSPDPKNIKTNIESDSTGNVIISEKVGALQYRPPINLPAKDFSKIQERQLFKDNWKKQAAALDGKTTVTEKRLFPKIAMGPTFDRIFGGNYVDFRPNGFVMLDFGGKIQKVDNPAFPVRQRKNGVFDFDQQISLNLVGKVGEKLKLTANFDTKSSFQFEQNIKLEYTGLEEDILQKVEAGNVSMPLNTTLIQGVQNLFGLKTKLKFGKLTITAVAANQRARIDAINVQGGVQTRPFEVRASEYEENRHFFIGQFFRDNYETSLKTLATAAQGTTSTFSNNNSFNNPSGGVNNNANPNFNPSTTNSGNSISGSTNLSGATGRSVGAASSGVLITRLEVYVTNRSNNTTTLRNIAGFLDLGESAKAYHKDGTLFTIKGGGLSELPTDNNANTLYQTLVNNTSIRNADNTSNTLQDLKFVKGTDFEQLRGVRKLSEREYTFNPQLGYLSLTTPLRNDEVIAVSYEYTYNGVPHKVGELTETSQNLTEDQVLILKLLRPSSIRIDLPTWNLMMKNIYSIGASQLSRQGFQFRIIYRDDLTGIDNPSLHEGDVDIKNVPLLQIFGMDQLNQLNDPQPDGNFDYIEGVTIDSQNGKIIFPVLEPFGSKLGSHFQRPDQTSLKNKYVFSELYSTTRQQASQQSNKNKFYLKGSYQGSPSSNVQLPGLGGQNQSARVTAGGILLTEGVDYVMEGGQVVIINDGIKNSGKEIQVQYEKPDLFQSQVRSLLGTRLDYQVNKDFVVGATIMRLRERPIITRVSVGDEPVNNTIFGMDVNFKKDSRFLTKMIDKLPFISTKEMSTVQFSAEYARIIPGVAPFVRGASYIDDFEAAETPYDMTRVPQQRWKLGATPITLIPNQPQNKLFINDHRAKLAWYSVDNVFFGGIGGNAARPSNISDEDIKNHYVRQVLPQEIFQKKAVLPTLPNQPLMDIAYYPSERGPYNYNPILNPDGTLPNPKSNYGAITRAINYDVDFDNANIQFIEFWMMDPFIHSAGNKYNLVAGKPADQNPGGDLIFNLGNISEDVEKNGRQDFENGLPATGDTTNRVVRTAFGFSPKQQFVINAFDNTAGARTNQDVGLDGLNNIQESTYDSIAGRFISKLPATLSPDAKSRIMQDPSADDFKNYLGPEQDGGNLKILERYKNYNGLEGNSPEAGANSFISSAATNLPDNEDLNTDNTINDIEAYYQYKVSLRPSDMVVGRNHIVDKVNSTVNGDNVTWYQFRIPIREYQDKVNNINGFKSIRFMRMFMTNFTQPTVMRMAQFQFLANQWRPYVDSLSGSLYQKGLNQYPEPYDAKFTLGSVGIEKNGSGNGTTTPYVIPPGAIRDRDITVSNSPQLNEQSLRLCVTDLKYKDARAVYKNVNLDLLNYKHIAMYVHAEGADSSAKYMHAFLRLGTDFQDNYYEIEVPLHASDPNKTVADVNANPYLVWPLENEINLALEELVNTKVERNQKGVNVLTPYTRPFDKYNITVVGNPDLTGVMTMMLGIRNVSYPDSKTTNRLDDSPRSRSQCVWFDELRTSGFNQTSGWAATSRFSAKLADFANITASAKHIGYGFGGVQQKISERARDNSTSWDFSMAANLDKFFPSKFGLRIPLFFSYQDGKITPYYDPLDKDVPLSKGSGGVNRFIPEDIRANYRKIIEDHTVQRSLNFTNVQKLKTNPNSKSHLWDISNFSFTYAYSDVKRTNVSTAIYLLKNYRTGIGYNFSNSSKPIEPFKNLKFLNSKFLKLIKDFNINLLPSSVSVRGDLDRRYIKTQYRNEQLTTDGILPTFEKYFTFNRQYNLRWSLSKALSFNYNATASAVIDEPLGELDTQVKKDSVWKNLLRLGRMKLFTQQVSASYRLPLDKFPATDWISIDIRYGASYLWNAGPLHIADTLGNYIQNTREKDVNGRLDLVRFYNKIKFLKDINDAQPPNPNAKKVLAKSTDTIKIKPDFKFLKGTLRAIMSIRNITFSYSVREQTALSGFKPVANYLGMDKAFSAPGLPFILGSQDPTIRERAAKNNWLVNSKSLNTPFTQGFTEDINLGALMEPFRDFKLTLTARRSRGKSFQEVYRDTTGNGNYGGLGANLNGNFSMSFIAVKTAFAHRGGNNQSDAFDQFVKNRDVIKARLTNINSADGVYNFNSQDVLMVAFVSAYGGKDPGKAKLSPFLNIPLPNWRLDYAGLAKIPAIKRKFSSVSITHSYTSTYNVGNYTSAIDYLGNYISPERFALMSNNYLLPTLHSTQDTLGLKRFIPVLIFNQVEIRERFGPFIGINMRTISKVTINVQYNRERIVGLNLSNAQVTEQTNQDVIMGLGFTKNKLKIPFRIQGETIVLKNEITFRCDFTFRDSRTIQRKIGDDPISTGGNLNIQLKPTINYVVNQRLNMQIYFERNINNPHVSTSFKRVNTNFGVQLRYSLTQ